MKSLVKLTLSACLFGLSLAGAFAQTDGDEFAPEAKPAKPEPKKDDNKVKLEEYEKAIKGLKRIDGPFPMYQRKRDLLVEVPDDKLGKLFFVQASLVTGASPNLQAGDPVGEMAVDVFRWDKQDNQLILARPNLKYRWNKDDMLKAASDRSFPEAILGAYRLEAYNPDKKINLVNLTGFLFGETFRLNELVNMALGGQYMLDRERTSIDTVKGYETNTVVQAKMHYMSPRGPGENNPILALLGMTAENQLEDARSVPLRVDFNFSYRNDDGYMPRLADPRVGYFTQDFYSMDRFLTTDRTERYIMRFNLKKKDPTQAVSEPVKPIVWILDPSIPEQYRPAVKDGIMRWNKAFEDAGFKNAIQVQEPPKDYDHADGRFNVVRWTVSADTPYAVAMPRLDPFTGQVLNASVTFDANFLAYVMNEHQTVATPTAAMAAMSTKALLRLPDESLTADKLIWEPESERLKEEARAKMSKLGWGALECEEAKGLAESAAFGWAAMQMAPGMKISKEEYAKEFVAEAICHEVGHCLGLRHNFEGSAYLSTDQLNDDSLTSRIGNTASVMDYVPVNIQAVLKGKGNFFSTNVGVYDKWAIQYGYEPVTASTPLGERPQLSTIASQSGLPGHAYNADENANRWDPYVVLYDNAKDPLHYNERMLEAALRTRKYALEKLNIHGQSFDKRTRLVLQSLLETFREGRMSARFIGGIHGSRSFEGDTGATATLSPVDAATQREAMHIIASKCFMPDSFRLSKDAMTHLTFDPSQEESASWTAPLRDIVTRFQDMLFVTVMSADTTDRIVENSYKLQGAKGGYTIDEHFSSVLGAVFREVGQNKSIDPTRRDLQRFATSALITQAGAPEGAINSDVRMLASDSLHRLSARFGAAMKSDKSVDEMTRIHLRDTKSMIDRFLNRQALSR